MMYSSEAEVNSQCYVRNTVRNTEHRKKDRRGGKGCGY